MSVHHQHQHTIRQIINQILFPIPGVSHWSLVTSFWPAPRLALACTAIHQSICAKVTSSRAPSRNWAYYVTAQLPIQINAITTNILFLFQINNILLSMITYHTNCILLYMFINNWWSNIIKKKFLHLTFAVFLFRWPVFDGFMAGVCVITLVIRFIRVVDEVSGLTPIWSDHFVQQPRLRWVDQYVLS